MVEFRSLIVSLGIAVVGLIAFFGLADSFNQVYNTNVGDNFNATQAKIRSLIGTNLQNISGDVGSSIEAQEGAELGADANDALGFRALGVITKLPRLMGVVTASLWEAGAAIGIPDEILYVALWVFVATFAITIAYLLITGVTRLFN
jgi:hypothetical protein